MHERIYICLRALRAQYINCIRRMSFMDIGMTVFSKDFSGRLRKVFPERNICWCFSVRCFLVRGELKHAFINKTANIHPDSKITIRIFTSPQTLNKPLQWEITGETSPKYVNLIEYISLLAVKRVQIRGFFHLEIISQFYF